MVITIKLKKSVTYILAVFASIMLISGCYDGEEPDSLAFVVAIGVDKAEEEREGYKITFQFANPTQISGGASEEGGKPGKESIKNITVPAPSIYSAINQANHMVSKTFTLAHTKLIVFSDEIAKEGIDCFLETVSRSSDIRPNTYFAVSKCSAVEFLEEVDPDTEVNPVRYYTMIFENNQSGFVPKNMSQDFYLYHDSEEKSCIMPLCDKASGENTNDYSDTGYQYKMGNFEAGKAPTGGDKGIQVMGMAVFDKDKKISEMKEIETEIYNILTGEYKLGYVTYYYDKSPDIPITLIQTQKRTPKIRVKTDTSNPKIEIELYMEADVCSSTPDFSLENDLQNFTEQIKKELKEQIEQFLNETQRLNTDIVGFGSYAKRNFCNENGFEDYKWRERYSNAEFDVTICYSIRRTGLMIRSGK